MLVLLSNDAITDQMFYNKHLLSNRFSSSSTRLINLESVNERLFRSHIYIYIFFFF